MPDATAVAIIVIGLVTGLLWFLFKAAAAPSSKPTWMPSAPATTAAPELPPPWVAFDVETTGLDPKTHRMVSLAAIRYEWFVAGTRATMKETRRLVTLLNPERRMGATKIHGLHTSDVKDAPHFRDIASQLLSVVDGAWLVGHKVAFDISFLEAELERAGRAPWYGKSLDSMEVAQKKLRLQNYKLPTCCQALSIDLTGYHDSEVDAVAAMLVAMKLLFPSAEATITQGAA